MIINLHKAHIVFSFELPLLCLLGILLLSKLQPYTENPYGSYLAYSTEQIRAVSNCYLEDDYGMRDMSSYCILRHPNGYIAFYFLHNGDLSSISFWRFGNVQVGDLYSLYGAPVSVRVSKLWTNTVFANDEYRIMVSAREDTLYSQVRFLWVSFR